MNVMLYKEMLDEVKLELAESDDVRDDLEILSALWQKRMAGQTSYMGVLKEIAEAVNRTHRESQGLEMLSRYLEQRLANQDAEFVVEFGQDGKPLNGPEAPPNSNNDLPASADGKKVRPPADASQELKPPYKFGSEGFILERKEKAAPRKTVKEAKETQVDFAEQKGTDTIYFDEKGNPIAQAAKQANH